MTVASLFTALYYTQSSYSNLRQPETSTASKLYVTPRELHTTLLHYNNPILNSIIMDDLHWEIFASEPTHIDGHDSELLHATHVDGFVRCPRCWSSNRLCQRCKLKFRALWRRQQGNVGQSRKSDLEASLYVDVDRGPTPGRQRIGDSL
jgi:hypothetical protein